MRFLKSKTFQLSQIIYIIPPLFEKNIYKHAPNNFASTHLPKSISFGRRNVAICQYGRRTITTEIEFDIKFIGLIYWPPDMRRRKREGYGYYLNVRIVELLLQHA